MAGHSLLRRIREPALAAPRRVVSDDEAKAAVLDHLQAMFLTRAGSAPSASDYGIVSVTDIVHSCPDAIDDVLKSIRHTIKKYEPRLLNVSVVHLPTEAGRDLTIRFEITADLLNGARRARVKFETIIDSARNVRVQ
ncbi:MAG: type VI secretion system baseplate subunit TssE [Labilithrix sp.]|nr:type VI secretion system baseplate subunit TssE [Labilithrix sp.]MCW5833028.1 type VI secretion system baseplate subunit TssE [Labilithrix sp.]